MQEKSNSLFSDSKGDVFFESSPEGTVFQVSKAFLSYASEHFEGMFDAPQPLGSEEGSLSFPIPIDADARVLDAVLRYIYPGRKPDFHNDIELLLRCIYFADKYVLLHHSLLKSNPFRIYAIACHFGWENAQTVALTATLPMDVIALEDIPELELMNGQHYRDIVRAHRSKLEQVEAAVDDLTRWRYQRQGDIVWATGESLVSVFHWWNRSRCKCNPKTTGSVIDGTFDSAPPHWLLEFQSNARQAFMTSCTSQMVEQVFDPSRIAKIAANTNCDGCVVNAVTHVESLQTHQKRINDVFAHLWTELI